MAQAARRYMSILIIVAAMLAPASHARAGVVTGSFATRQGAPLADRQIHFENSVSGDIYIVHTGKNGSFSASLPPATYDLRAEHGVILKPAILVGTSEQDVGRVEEPAPMDLWRLFEAEQMAPAVVESAAPSTANIQIGGGAAAAPSRTAK